jgi:hypothetical protein
MGKRLLESLSDGQVGIRNAELLDAAGICPQFRIPNSAFRIG